MPYVVSHTSGNPPIPSNRLPSFAPSPMYDFIFWAIQNHCGRAMEFPSALYRGLSAGLCFFLWCPSTLQCPSIHPGSPATAHILSVSACGQSILFSSQQVPPAGSRPLILWTEVLGMCHLRHIPAAPGCPMDSGSRSIRLPQPAHRAWCPASRIFPYWRRRGPVHCRCRSL